MNKMIFIALAAILSLGSITACSDDPENAHEINCEDDELYNPRDKTCVKTGSNIDQDAGTNALDDTKESTDDDAQDILGDTKESSDDDAKGSTDDAGDQPDTPDAIDPECDRDDDGHLAYECGGSDCDDNNPNVFPGQFETCNGIDDNCNGLVDEFLECTFFAHTRDALYRVNPFEATLDKESDLVDAQKMPITLLDIDTHPSGTLYGITNVGLYIFDTTENHWVKAATLTGAKHANGLAIDFDGVAFITLDDQLFKLDLTNTEELLYEKGLKDSSFSNRSISLQSIQITPKHFKSSGDSVVNKQNTLFMTSKHDITEDYLVEVNRDTAAAVSIGPVGFTRVFGLTAGWDNLYGTTRDGELITIDTKTGKGTLIKKFADKTWFGAASSPNR